MTCLNFNQGNPAHGAAAARVGGGQLFSHGCHYIDVLLRFLGNPVCGSRLGWDCQIQTEKGLLDYDRFKGIIKFYNHKEHIPGALEENAEKNGFMADLCGLGLDNT